MASPIIVARCSAARCPLLPHVVLYPTACCMLSYPAACCMLSYTAACCMLHAACCATAVVRHQLLCSERPARNVPACCRYCRAAIANTAQCFLLDTVLDATASDAECAADIASGKQQVGMYLGGRDRLAMYKVSAPCTATLTPNAYRSAETVAELAPNGWCTLMLATE